MERGRSHKRSLPMTNTPPAPPPPPDREARLKAALRDNLRRRKEAARADTGGDRPVAAATTAVAADGTTPFTIGFVLFPMVTQLDFTGPLQVLHRLPGARVLILAADLSPVPSDCGLGLMPTETFANCPPLDMICVPGGFGVEAAMQDSELVGFVRRQAAGARYVTSVCTGTFVLGAAGLLEGRRATTHWAYHALLARCGAVPTQGRVVRDGNLVTGGGVTAGIDFALTIAAEIAGEDLARRIQLSIEYDPAPPFSSGHPDRADASVRAPLEQWYGKRNETFALALDRVMAAGPVAGG